MSKPSRRPNRQNRKTTKTPTAVVRTVRLQAIGEFYNEAGQRVDAKPSQVVEIQEAEFHLSLRDLLTRFEGCTVPPAPTKETE